MKRTILFNTTVFLPALLATVLAGCGGEERTDRPKVFPVSGKIIFGDNNLEDAVVKLFPVELEKDIGTPLRPRARVKEDGSFSIGTYAAGDGAPAGEYVITVSWRGDLSDFDDEDDDIEDYPELIPWEYTVPAQSKLRVTVKEQDENVVPEITIES